MKHSFSFLLILVISSCSQTKNIDRTSISDNESFVITEISTDKTYGLTSKNPVEVGGNNGNSGPSNERKYLNMLAGPNGEKISYFRAGSCCPVKSKKGFMGYAMLDNYRVTWEGTIDTVSIYINMYDKGVLKAPVGFTIKKD
ncbi:MAG: 2-dehydro-3-deoxyphosphooctonate aldolase [Chitinophagaceae bacterium]|nr:2-dehydro-3-deoxyphosphooctonate aldolase [Chitinophagaceae bacterium]